MRAFAAAGCSLCSTRTRTGTATPRGGDDVMPQHKRSATGANRGASEGVHCADQEHPSVNESPDKRQGHALVAYDAACRAHDECSRVDEAKAILDKSVAIKAYARQAGDTTLAANADRIRWRATERLGELLADAIPHQGGRPSENGQKRGPLLSE